MDDLIYGITIQGKLFSGYAWFDNAGFLKSIETTECEIVVKPCNFKIFDTAED